MPTINLTYQESKTLLSILKKVERVTDEIVQEVHAEHPKKYSKKEIEAMAHSELIKACPTIAPFLTKKYSK